MNEKVSLEFHKGWYLGLFVIYINDLPKSIANVKVSMYAGDTGIYCSSKDVNDIVNKMNVYEGVCILIDRNSLFLLVLMLWRGMQLVLLMRRLRLGD